MGRSRTIKTLTALLVAMTFGAFSLTLLETAPLTPPSPDLAVAEIRQQSPVEVVFETNVPMQPMRWRYVVIHSSAEGRGIAERCHFIVAPAANARDFVVRRTELWNRQQTGRHVNAVALDFNSNSIGICLVGDFTPMAPSRLQLDKLISLVHALQRRCNIPPDRVYLNDELDPHSASPGDAFPAEYFNANLLMPSR